MTKAYKELAKMVWMENEASALQLVDKFPLNKGIIVQLDLKSSYAENLAFNVKYFNEFSKKWEHYRLYVRASLIRGFDLDWSGFVPYDLHETLEKWLNSEVE